MKYFSIIIIQSSDQNVSYTIDKKQFLDIEQHISHNAIKFGGWRAGENNDHNRNNKFSGSDFSSNYNSYVSAIINFSLNSSNVTLSFNNTSRTDSQSGDLKLYGTSSNTSNDFGNEFTQNQTQYEPQIPEYIRTTSMVFCIVIMCLGVIGNIMVSVIFIRPFLLIN